MTIKETLEEFENSHEFAWAKTVLTKENQASMLKMVENGLLSLLQKVREGIKERKDALVNKGVRGDGVLVLNELEEFIKNINEITE